MRLNKLKYIDAVRIDKRNLKTIFKKQIFVRENFLYTFCYYHPLDS